VSYVAVVSAFMSQKQLHHIKSPFHMSQYDTVSNCGVHLLSVEFLFWLAVSTDLVLTFVPLPMSVKKSMMQYQLHQHSPMTVSSFVGTLIFLLCIGLTMVRQSPQTN
jgi:hypothetical protein